MNTVLLALALARATAAGTAPPDPSPPATTTTPAPVLHPCRRPLGVYGRVGLGVLTGGIVLTATGAGLAVAGESRPADKSRVRDLRPAGFTLLGMGAAAVVGGTALVVVDRVLAGRGRARANHYAVHPTVSTVSAGVVVTGSF